MMKKMLCAAITVLLIVTSTGCNQQKESKVEPTETKSQMTDSEISDLAGKLMTEGQTVFWWYHDNANQDLGIDIDGEKIEIDGEHGGEEYAKVGKFHTMAELKAATEAVFTSQFCNTHFYDKIEENNLFREIDGVLYNNLNVGGMGWIYSLPKEYTVKSVEDNKIVLLAICDGLDFSKETGDTVEYEFELTLLKDDTGWKVNDYYDFTATEDSTDRVTLHNPNPEDLKRMEVDLMKQKYIDPLGLTSLIGQTWLSPNEIDPYDILVAYEITVVEGGTADKYVNAKEDDGNLYFPKDELEAYANGYFGVEPEQMRKTDRYDSIAETYFIELGLGGGWGVTATDYKRNNNLVEIQYNLISGEDYVSAKGVLAIEIHADDSYRYLSNTVTDEPYTRFIFPASYMVEVSEGKVTMHSMGQVTIAPDTEAEKSYDGEDLASIIAYYEENLSEIHAEGVADSSKTEDGWAWSGTDDKGVALSIEVQPDSNPNRAAGYLITVLY